MSARARIEEAGALLFFMLLAVVATRPLVSDLWGQTLAGPDPLIDLWTVDWLSGHLLQPSRLFEGNIFHPAPHAAVYSDLSLGTAVLAAPLRPFLGDPVPLYNAAVLLALAFGGWAFYRLTAALTGSRSAGLLAGVLAAFSSHQLYHAYHLNLLSIGWLAMLLLGLHALLGDPRASSVVLAGLSFALAAQSSGYYAVAALMLAALLALARWRRLLERRVLLAAGAAGLLALLLVLPYARAFLDVREREGLRRPPRMSERMAFQPGQDLTSHGYLGRRLFGSEGERLFPGILCLGLGAIALLRRAPNARLYAGGALLLFVVSLGPRLALFGVSLPLPYRVLFAIPPLDAMRHPYTFAAVATFLLAVLAGIGAAALRIGPWSRAGLVAAAVLETLAPPLAVRPVPAGLPPAYRRIAELPPGPVLEVPVFAEDTLVWAARHGWPVLNGVGAFVPRETQALETAISNHWLKRVPESVDGSRPLELLDETPMRYLIVPQGRVPRLHRLAEALDRSPSFRLVAEAEDGDRVYEIVR